ncbi:hypothetical protein [Methylobacter sp.]|uniref:hypothetical protein n=1 Tax=Methylobacter sp. TaxID=2051955 RepID=UPI001222238C|nr:hypothetical protein [Methylobacter sp.]TAK59488.1 MAG: hypothetical protein EPO18_20205 [Methylobacter sp.]
MPWTKKADDAPGPLAQREDQNIKRQMTKEEKAEAKEQAAMIKKDLAVAKEILKIMDKEIEKRLQKMDSAPADEIREAISKGELEELTWDWEQQLADAKSGKTF